MGNDTLRVGDRVVALAEMAHENCGGCEHDVNLRALVQEVRRLRAVESAARRYRNHSRTTFACATGCGDELDAALAAAPPETGDNHA